jgi:hypothetical protein
MLFYDQFYQVHIEYYICGFFPILILIFKCLSTRDINSGMNIT